MKSEQKKPLANLVLKYLVEKGLVPELTSPKKAPYTKLAEADLVQE